MLGPVTVSQLAGLAAMANIVYVSDGTLGSNPCSGGGTGAYALYIAGAWNCNAGISATGPPPLDPPPGGAGSEFQYRINDSTFGGTFDADFNSSTGETDIANLNKVPNVTPYWNFSFTDSGGSLGDLTSAGASKTLTMPCTATAPCLGFDTTNNTDAPYTVYISGTGTAEAALVTGGTCTINATASCTLVVTTVNAHPNDYTVSSASTGIQEAINFCAQPGCPAVLMPTATGGTPRYTVHGAVYLKNNRSYLGTPVGKARIQCSTRDACIRTSSILGGNTDQVVENIEFVPLTVAPGVNISSVKADAGRYTITTSAAHGYVTGDWVMFRYYTFAQSQEARVQVFTGANCINGTGGAGACTSTEYEYVLGSTTFTSSSGYGETALENAALEDISGHLTMRNLTILGGSGRFTNGIVIGNDQSALIDGLSVATGNAITCTAGYCGAAIFARGDQGAAPVLWVTHSELSMQCSGNGLRFAGGNGLHIRDTIAQGFSQYGVFYGGGLQQWDSQAWYEEVSICTNPAYPVSQISSLGYFSGGPSLTILTDTALSGAQPSFPAANVGAQQNNYYVVINSAGSPASPPLYIGKCLTTGVGNCTGYFPEPNLDSQPSLTYDVLVVIGTAVVPPYTGSSPQSVVTGLTHGVNCSATGICTFVDPQTGYSAYTLNTQATVLRYNFWPGSVLLSNASKLKIDSCGGAGIMATTYLPSVICRQSAASATGAGTSPVLEQLSSNYSSSSNAGSRPVIEGSGAGAGAGGLVGTAGVGIHFGGVAQGDWDTLATCNYPKVAATPNHRPTAETCDTAIGFDNAQGAAANVAQLAFRAPVAISSYIGTMFDGTSSSETLTATGKSFNTPVTFFQNAVALGGAFGFSPFSLVTPPVTNCLSGSGGNMTSINGSFTYSGGTATYASGNPALSACTATTFNANQSMQIKAPVIGGGQVGVSLRGTNTPGDLTMYLFKLLAGSWFIQKCNAAGTCSTLATGSGTFPNGRFITASVTGTTTAVINGYVDGILIGTASDSSTPITSGYPGIVVYGGGSASTATAISQAWETGVDVSLQNAVINNSVTMSAQSANAGHATCFKTDGVIGYCSTAVDSSGLCTCN